MRQAADKFRWSAKLAADEGIIPYKSEKGAWVASPYDGNSWWTGGFWPGLMWQLHCATGDEQFQTEARRVEKLLTDEFRTFRCLNHDVGFMYLLSCGADAKLTGDEQAKTDTLHAASLLMGRFNPAGFIRAWNHPDQRGFAIIDCMMNLSLLWWATRETGDPRFAKVAQIHAQTTLREFLRPEFINRVDEVICFNRLDEQNFAGIARIMLSELQKSLEDKGLHFTWDEDVEDYLVKKSYSATYGARNLRRTIQKDLEDPIAEKLIDSYEHPVTQIHASMEDGKLVVRSL